MKTESLIGMQYIPQDNSYEFNLTNKYSKQRYLAGTFVPNTEPTITTITSEPFNMVIKSEHGDKQNRTHKMVLVEVEDCTFLTMFYQHGLVTEQNSIDSVYQRRNNILNL